MSIEDQIPDSTSSINYTIQEKDLESGEKALSPKATLPFRSSPIDTGATTPVRPQSVLLEPRFQYSGVPPENTSSIDSSIKDQITQIFNDNMIHDLEKILNRRDNFNKANIALIYFFYVFQYSGILTTTIATTYNTVEIIYIGVSLNLLASLIHASININKSISDRLMKDLILIKTGKYIDESNIEMEEK